MGYRDKLQKLCALRGLDQSELASRVGMSKSTISRILSGAQEPKLSVAYDLARELGVPLDYLVDESPDVTPTAQLVMVTEDELTILKMVRVLGTGVSMTRLLHASPGTPAPGAEAPPVPNPPAARGRDSRRNDPSGD